MAVDTFSSTLLPAHFDAISSCWNESLATAPIAERTKLVSFLMQLHSHFNNWQGRRIRLVTVNGHLTAQLSSFMGRYYSGAGRR